MKTFEVTGFGFDASTDATDDRVFWVKAHSHEEVRQAIAGTKAGFHDTIDADDQIDFHLPVQAGLLKSKLLEFEIDDRKVGNCNEAGYKEAADFFSSQAKSACYPGGIHISGLVHRPSSGTRADELSIWLRLK